MEQVKVEKGELFRVVSEGLIGSRLQQALTTKKGEVIAPKGRKVTPHLFKEIKKARLSRLPSR